MEKGNSFRRRSPCAFLSLPARTFPCHQNDRMIFSGRRSDILPGDTQSISRKGSRVKRPVRLSLYHFGWQKKVRRSGEKNEAQELRLLSGKRCGHGSVGTYGNTKISSIGASTALEIWIASLRDGLYWAFSNRIIVSRRTPTISDNCSCVIFFSNLYFFKLHTKSVITIPR